jgi:hypothetical protein
MGTNSQRGTKEGSNDGKSGKFHRDDGDKSREEQSNAPGEENPDQPADKADQYRLDEELLPDVALPGAYGHPYPDLVGPLGDGDEHDVHDPYPSHHQGDDRNSGDQERQCRGRLFNRLQDRVAAAGVEVLATVALAKEPDTVLFGDLVGEWSIPGAEDSPLLSFPTGFTTTSRYYKQN